MHLDVGTLSVVSVFVTALLGALLVFAGVQNRNIRAPMWWGGAQIVGAIGLGLAASSDAVPTFVSADIANALVLLGYGLTKTKHLILSGQIRSVKDGGHRKILPEWVDEYIRRKVAEDQAA